MRPVKWGHVLLLLVWVVMGVVPLCGCEVFKPSEAMVTPPTAGGRALDRSSTGGSDHSEKHRTRLDFSGVNRAPGPPAVLAPAPPATPAPVQPVAPGSKKPIRIIWGAWS